MDGMSVIFARTAVERLDVNPNPPAFESAAREEEQRRTALDHRSALTVLSQCPHSALTVLSQCPHSALMRIPRRESVSYTHLTLPTNREV